MRNGNWRQILQLPHVSGGTTLRHVPLCPPEVPRDIGPGAHSGDLHIQGNLCRLPSLTGLASPLTCLSFLASLSR